MNDFMPFDHQPDPVLGEALRELLSEGGSGGTQDDAAFASRVLAQVGAGPAESWWDVLSEWARPGLAAAVLLLLATGVWLAGSGPARDAPPAPPEEATAVAETLTAGTLLASRTAPEFNADLVLAGGPAPQ